jgi:hypothetical protein
MFALHKLISRIIDDLEIKQLLRPDTKKKVPASNGLKIDLESKMMSLQDPEFEARDKAVHPEFDQA